MILKRDPGLIALTRFGYGPRGDGDVAAAASDPRGFLKAELTQPGIASLSGPGLASTPAVIAQYFADQERRKSERADAAALDRVPAISTQAPNAGSDRSPPIGALAKIDPTKVNLGMNGGGPRPQPIAPMSMSPISMSAMPLESAKVAKPPSPEQIVFRDEALARIRRAVETRVGFAERLVAFWSNHFCISANKGGIARSTAGAFEREAIRPHVLGTFADMLIAVESHPAMLHYLDNAQSVGPNSRAGQRGKRGLNENLGREILELHTLGVDGGYTQTDVTALAKILTGWTFVGKLGLRGAPGAFAFNPNAHEPGPIELLGRTYRDDGFDQGRAALLDLARRPETAHFIARKIAIAFIADDPPKPLVARLARVFQDKDGNLRALAEALIEAPESWDQTPSRMRTPYEFVIATDRLLNHLPDDAGQILGPLTGMGMALWTPPGPNGFPYDARAWASPEGMKVRLDYCALVASRLREPPNPSDLLEALCGGAPSEATRLAVSRAESRQQGLALLLMSPEMQRS